MIIEWTVPRWYCKLKSKIGGIHLSKWLDNSIKGSFVITFLSAWFVWHGLGWFDRYMNEFSEPFLLVTTAIVILLNIYWWNFWYGWIEFRIVKCDMEKEN